MTCSCGAQTRVSLPSSPHLFPFSPGVLVFGFFYFPEVCPLFPSLPFFFFCFLFFLCDTCTNICSEVGGEKGEGGRRGEAAVYSRQTAAVSPLFSGPIDAERGNAAVGSRCPAKSAIFCPYPPRVRAPAVVSRLCESKERLSEGRKRDRGRGVR